MIRKMFLHGLIAAVAVAAIAFATQIGATPAPAKLQIAGKRS